MFSFTNLEEVSNNFCLNEEYDLYNTYIRTDLRPSPILPPEFTKEDQDNVLGIFRSILQHFISERKS